MSGRPPTHPDARRDSEQSLPFELDLGSDLGDFGDFDDVSFGDTGSVQFGSDAGSEFNFPTPEGTPTGAFPPPVDDAGYSTSSSSDDDDDNASLPRHHFSNADLVPDDYLPRASEVVPPPFGELPEGLAVRPDSVRLPPSASAEGGGGGGFGPVEVQTDDEEEEEEEQDEPKHPLYEAWLTQKKSRERSFDQPLQQAPAMRPHMAPPSTIYRLGRCLPRAVVDVVSVPVAGGPEAAAFIAATAARKERLKAEAEAVAATVDRFAMVTLREEFKDMFNGLRFVVEQARNESKALAAQMLEQHAPAAKPSSFGAPEQLVVTDLDPAAAALQGRLRDDDAVEEEPLRPPMDFLKTRAPQADDDHLVRTALRGEPVSPRRLRPPQGQASRGLLLGSEGLIMTSAHSRSPVHGAGDAVVPQLAAEAQGSLSPRRRAHRAHAVPSAHEPRPRDPSLYVAEARVLESPRQRAARTKATTHRRAAPRLQPAPVSRASAPAPAPAPASAPATAPKKQRRPSKWARRASGDGGARLAMQRAQAQAAAHEQEGLSALERASAAARQTGFAAAAGGTPEAHTAAAASARAAQRAEEDAHLETLRLAAAQATRSMPFAGGGGGGAAAPQQQQQPQQPQQRRRRKSKQGARHGGIFELLLERDGRRASNAPQPVMLEDAIKNDMDPDDLQVRRKSSVSGR